MTLEVSVRRSPEGICAVQAGCDGGAGSGGGKRGAGETSGFLVRDVWEMPLAGTELGLFEVPRNDIHAHTTEQAVREKELFFWIVGTKQLSKATEWETRQAFSTMIIYCLASARASMYRHQLNA